MRSRTCDYVLYWSAVVAITLPTVVLSQTRTPTNESLSDESSQVQNGTQGQTGVLISDHSDRTPLESGMVTLFEMTNSFLGIVQKNRLYDQQWINFTAIGRQNYESISVWQNWASYFVGFAVCVAFGVVFLLALPIAGLVVCCCRCCGKCGGKRRLTDPKNANCKRTALALSLVILNTVMLAGVICIYLSNEILHNRMQSSGPTGIIPQSQKTMNTFVSYVNNTTTAMRETVLNTFDKTATEVKRQLNESANSTVNQVADLVNATSLLQQASSLSKEVNSTYTDIIEVQRLLGDLINQSKELSRQLKDVKSDVSSVCNHTGVNCSRFQLDKYNTDANFTGIDNLNVQQTNLSGVLDMSRYIQQAEKSIDEIKVNATQSIQQQINDASKKVDEIRNTIQGGMQSVQQQIGNITSFAPEFDKTLNDSMEPVKMYSNYVWYGGLAVASAFLLIVVLFYMGLLWGQCGERPGYDAGCCNKGTAANVLTVAVFFCFFLGWVLMLIVVALFVTGGPTYTEVCRYFRNHNPEELKPFDQMIADGIDLKNRLFKGKDINMSFINGLQDCQNNTGIFTAFRLDEFVNLDSVANASIVEQEVARLKNQTIRIANITLLNQDLKNTITRLAEAGLDQINFTSFHEQLEKNLTLVNLDVLASQLDFAVNQSASFGWDENVTHTLNNSAEVLRNLSKGLVVEMIKNKNDLAAVLVKLQNHSNIKNLTNSLLASLEQSQNDFNTNGSLLAKQEINKVADSISKYIADQITNLKSTVRNDVGRCKPVSDALYTATDIACQHVLDPVNCLWFSMGWCLFFFIPCIILAIKLADLFRPEQEYEEQKGFDDQNYTMYGGPNPDTIPLTSMNGQHDSRNSAGLRNAGYYREDYTGKHYDNDYYNNGPQYPDDHHYQSAELPGNRRNQY